MIPCWSQCTLCLELVENCILTFFNSIVLWISTKCAWFCFLVWSLHFTSAENKPLALHCPSAKNPQLSTTLGIKNTKDMDKVYFKVSKTSPCHVIALPGLDFLVKIGPFASERDILESWKSWKEHTCSFQLWTTVKLFNVTLEHVKQ